MATKLTFKAETHYNDILESPNTNSVMLESYVEGESNNIVWRFEEFCKFLKSEGYSTVTIQKYLNYDGSEVFEIGESDEV